MPFVAVIQFIKLVLDSKVTSAPPVSGARVIERSGGYASGVISTVNTEAAVPARLALSDSKEIVAGPVTTNGSGPRLLG